MYHVYFEPELLALRKELENHLELLLILKVQQDPDIYVHILEIATYLGIILEGTYTKQEYLNLCRIMTERLIKKRSFTIDLSRTKL